MTMWRPIESGEDDVSDVHSVDPQKRRRRSRRRAWRDGLASQTIIEPVEDVRCYRSFERIITASFAPRSVVELELVHRLASLLWRLRRAIAAETGLLQAQGESPPATNEGSICASRKTAALPDITEANRHYQNAPTGSAKDNDVRNGDRGRNVVRPPLRPLLNCPSIAQRFLSLSRLDPSLLDRAGAYEMRLWRQAAQTIWILDTIRRPPPAAARRSSRSLAPHPFWDLYIKNL
jgi:hypothetical protein